MATTVIKSIGTSSRDYSTLQAWEDASPSDLTATRSNNCTGGTTGTIILDAGASGTNDFYTGHTVVNFSSEERLITAYNGTTKIATIGALNGSSATWTTPTTGQAFTINAVIWQGQCYNDSEFSIAGADLLTISGETTSATSYIELTTASGQSFQDAAGVRTNALKYNQANGVALKRTGLGGIQTAIYSNVNYTRINKLQIFSNDVGLYSVILSGTNSLAKDLVVKCDSNSRAAVCMFGTSSIAVNVLVFLTGTGGTGMRFASGQGVKLIACTVIRTSDVSPSGVAYTQVGYGYYTTQILKDCAAFGCTSPTDQTFSSSSSNNATDQASGFSGTSNQYSITYSSTTPFTNSSVASQNSIPVSGTNLSGNGVLDSTNAPNDITGTARPAGPTIGVWQLTATANTDPPFNRSVSIPRHYILSIVNQ